MADALLSPEVGVAVGALAVGAVAYSASRLRVEEDDRRIPLMGVTAAFVFAAQMINFTIPGTGSSGHLGGGLLLALLLGPHAGLIALASVVIVQCFFLADGGVLALGANILHLGVIPCWLGYAVFRAIAGKDPAGLRWGVAAVAAAFVSLELGALGVVAETVLSGRTELPFAEFAVLMVAIHAPIALVEGIVTITVIRFVERLRPGVLARSVGATEGPAGGGGWGPVLGAFGVGALLTGGLLVWMASVHPDGLEWSLARLTGSPEAVAAGAPEGVRGRTAILPDYDVPGGEGGRAGASLSGLLGGAMTLGAVLLFACAVRFLRRRRSPPSGSDVGG